MKRESNLSSEQLAALLFGDQAVARLTPEQFDQIHAEVDRLGNKLDGVVETKHVGFATEKSTEDIESKPDLQCEPADGFLDEASRQMKHRAALRDRENGERTAAQIAKVFNAITGNRITEADAWMFLIVLKIVRSRNGKYNRDDYVDLAAYASLLGECESIRDK